MQHGGGRKCVYEGCRKSRRGNDLCLEHGGVEVDDSPTASDQYYDYPPAVSCIIRISV